MLEAPEGIRFLACFSFLGPHTQLPSAWKAGDFGASLLPVAIALVLPR